MNCIDLRKTFGDRYRIKRDEAATIKEQDPWLWIIPGRYAEIYPQGGTRLAAWTHRAGKIGAQLRRLPCVEVRQDGDDGCVVIFDVADFDLVAAIVKPYKRKKLSPESAAKAAARLVALRERRNNAA